MFLNETNPPLDEALTHYGVKGMRWGVRKARASSEDDEFDFGFNRPSRKKKFAQGALIVVGGTAAAVVLNKHGMLPKKTILAAAANAAKGATSRMAEERLKNAGRDPKNWRGPSRDDFPSYRPRSDGYDGPTNEARIRNGAYVVNTLDNDFWDSPVRF